MNLNLKKIDIFYIIGLVAAAIFMILEMIFGFVALNITYLIFFWTMKLLSGFGLIITVSNIILWVLNRFTEKFSKKDVQVLVIIQILVPGIFIGYAIYSIISSLPPAIPPTGIQYWLDLIMFLYGIISLILSLYIIPLIKEEFQEAVDTGIINRVKKGSKKIGRKMKKGYYSWRGKYAKVQIQDQMTLGEVLNIWRNRFAVYLLIPIAIGSIIFTPVAFICIVFWLKIIALKKSEPKFYERIALLISMIFIATIACLSYTFNLVFFTSIESFFWTIQVFYLFGIVISAVIFIYQFTKLKGITIKKIKEEIREKRTAED
jgi:MFS family permease